VSSLGAHRVLATLALAAISFAASGCGAAKHPKTVSLRMSGSPATAIVTIDDQTMGPLGFVGRRGVALPPGTHRVTVESPGYFPADHLVSARAEPVLLDVNLERVPE
jgi:hypothetical protein